MIQSVLMICTLTGPTHLVKAMKRFFLLLMLVLFVGACTSSVQEAEPARQILIEYLKDLNQGDYFQADGLYGGSYELLTTWNPEIEPTDHASLWEAGCSRNGLQCLLTRSVLFKEKVNDIYIFSVEFKTPNGDLFILGPCCGATETEQPPVTHFDFRVQKTPQGKLQVLDMPVYMP
jgi:hypothetical protein